MYILITAALFTFAHTEKEKFYEAAENIEEVRYTNRYTESVVEIHN